MLNNFNSDTSLFFPEVSQRATHPILRQPLTRPVIMSPDTLDQFATKQDSHRINE